MYYFSIFFKKFNKPCVNLLRIWTKNTLLGNFEKVLKIFDEVSIEKLNFYFIFIFNFIFRKCVTKNRAFGNNTIFLQQFFRFRGGGISRFPPGYALGSDNQMEIMYSYQHPHTCIHINGCEYKKFKNELSLGISIMNAVIEVFGNEFQPGELGPGAILGSAAFTFFVVTAVCIVSVTGILSNNIFHTFLSLRKDLQSTYAETSSLKCPT